MRFASSPRVLQGSYPIGEQTNKQLHAESRREKEFDPHHSLCILQIIGPLWIVGLGSDVKSVRGDDQADDTIESRRLDQNLGQKRYLIRAREPFFKRYKVCRLSLQ